MGGCVLIGGVDAHVVVGVIRIIVVGGRVLGGRHGGCWERRRAGRQPSPTGRIHTGNVATPSPRPTPEGPSSPVLVTCKLGNFNLCGAPLESQLSCPPTCPLSSTSPPHNGTSPRCPMRRARHLLLFPSPLFSPSSSSSSMRIWPPSTRTRSPSSAPFLARGMFAILCVICFRPKL